MPTAPFKPSSSYAEIVARRGITGSDHEKAVSALSKLMRRPRIDISKAKLERIYVRGIARMPIKELKEALRSLRLRLSAICSISFVGASIAEFLVTSDYAKSFARSITSLSPVEGRISILSAYNAAAVTDPKATEEIQKKCTAAFVRRVHGLITKHPNETVKNFYTNWLQELNLPLPEAPTEAPGATFPAGLAADTNQDLLPDVAPVTPTIPDCPAPLPGANEEQLC
jgi:hypothetical protein